MAYQKKRMTSSSTPAPPQPRALARPPIRSRRTLAVFLSQNFVRQPVGGSTSAMLSWKLSTERTAVALLKNFVPSG